MKDAAQLEPGATRVFEVESRGQKKEAFILHYEGVFHAFLNECPHWSIELDLGDHHFFDEELDRVYCKNHGALFFPHSGVCETGPCLGRSLVRYETTVDGDDVLVTVPD